VSKRTSAPAVSSPAKLDLTPRQQLHHAVRTQFATALQDYFWAHPEQLRDPATEANTKALLLLMERVLAAIDRFDIAAATSAAT